MPGNARGYVRERGHGEELFWEMARGELASAVAQVEGVLSVRAGETEDG